MVYSRMTTPVNRYYLRSCDQLSSGETTPDYQQEESSGDSSINLSDLEFEVEDNYIDFNSAMARGIHITIPLWRECQGLGGIVQQFCRRP